MAISSPRKPSHQKPCTNAGCKGPGEDQLPALALSAADRGRDTEPAATHHHHHPPEHGGRSGEGRRRAEGVGGRRDDDGRAYDEHGGWAGRAVRAGHAPHRRRPRPPKAPPDSRAIHGRLSFSPSILFLLLLLLLTLSLSPPPSVLSLLSLLRSPSLCPPCCHLLSLRRPQMPAHSSTAAQQHRSTEAQKHRSA